MYSVTKQLYRYLNMDLDIDPFQQTRGNSGKENLPEMMWGQNLERKQTRKETRPLLLSFTMENYSRQWVLFGCVGILGSSCTWWFTSQIHWIWDCDRKTDVKYLNGHFCWCLARTWDSIWIHCCRRLQAITSSLSATWVLGHHYTL